MSDDSAFIQAILSSHEAELRLIYADWLEERGDPRAELVRLDMELSANSERSDELQKRFDALRPSVSLVWQALILDPYLEPCSPRPAGPEGTGPVVCPNGICGCHNPAFLRHCAFCQYPLPLAAGSIVAGRYRVDQQITLGGFGYIYRGVLLQNGQPIVVKELTAVDSLDFSYLVPFFRQEADLLSSLQPNPIIVRLIEYFEQDRDAYLVMEDVGDKSIDASPGSAFPLDWVVEVGKHLCDLLDCMHRRDPPLLCADLRVDQLYLALDRQTVKVLPEFRSRVKYLLRRLWERLQGIGGKCLPREGMDNPPERVIGKPEPRSDLFYLTGVLYRLLTGRSSEGTYTRQEIFQGFATIPADQRWLYELIAVNLSELVFDRYYSARAIQNDLARRTVTRQATCLHCGKGNPMRQPYCDHCSQPLTDWAPHACPHCEKRYPMGASSCPNCRAQVWG